MAARGRLVRYGTTAIDQFLLMATVALLPLQDHLPSIAGFSIMYIIFGVLGGYVLLSRSRALARVWTHPVFLAAYVLLFLGFLVESIHPNSSYVELVRCGYMIAGAVLVASLCRDRKALRACVYGYLVASVWLSVLLLMTSYGALQGTIAVDFEEASQVRAEVFADKILQANLNMMAFICAQGAIVALVLALTASSRIRRCLFLSVALLCLIATFVPMSRSGIVIAIVTSLIVLFTYQGKRMRAMVAALALGIGVLIWVPDVVLSRLQYSTETRGDRMEGRALVYTASIEHLPEYVVTGVGAGNFWGWWAYSNGFGDDEWGVGGAHNCFFQVTIYWGLAGLLALIAVIWRAYRCLPKRCGDDTLALCLQGIAFSLLLWMLAMHNFYAKEFSLGLGLLVSARHWIWPKGIVQFGVAQIDTRAKIRR
jgi:hypothetical protein